MLIWCHDVLPIDWNFLNVLGVSFAVLCILLDWVGDYIGHSIIPIGPHIISFVIEYFETRETKKYLSMTDNEIIPNRPRHT